MNYDLNRKEKAASTGLISSIRKLVPLITGEQKNLTIAFVAIFANSLLNLAAPLLIGYAVDHYIRTKDFYGVLVISIIVFCVYCGALVASYIQTKTMGGVGQRVLFNLRGAVFNKLQELPVAFFNQNKAGDLISRINNDTDKLNQFFSQSLMQFIGNVFIIIGAAIFILFINLRLGGAALLPAIGLLVLTFTTQAFVKRTNAASLKTTGGLSAEIQESIANFKVIVAFDRRDYFREKFQAANDINYIASVKTGIVNTILLSPLYNLVANLAQLIVLGYGIYLISIGSFSIGLLISFFTYISRFYDPLRQMAQISSQFQLASAGLDRVSDILSLENDLVVLPELHNTETQATDQHTTPAPLLEFKDVSFSYPNNPERGHVLHNISFTLEKGKIYALVGPTGGGKTTTASLMARLYDPSSGMVLLEGRDIRTYEATDRAQKIGFILQEPFLFTGTLKENILYGNTHYIQENQLISNEEFLVILRELGFEDLVTRFDNGLDTLLNSGTGTISLGEKQIIAFMRAVLRRPDILILDEATANIDTVTEELLERIIKKLPTETVQIIIAHRLNTIQNADEILFVNGGDIVRAGSFEHAVDMLMHGTRQS